MMGRWMRRIWPFPQAALFVLVFVSVPFLLYNANLKGNDETQFVFAFSSILAFCYGGLRAVHFFPNERNDYGQWLAATPWRGPQRLPFGSVHLVPQDAVVPAVYLAATWWLTDSLALGMTMVLTALISYYLGIAGLCGSKRSGWAGYAIMLCLAFAMAFALTHWLALLFLLPCELFARWGIANSLRQFPEWSGQLDGEQRLPPEWLKRDGKRVRGTLGWPHSVFHPCTPPEPISFREPLLISVQFGVWLWAFIHLTKTLLVRIASTDPDIALQFVQRCYPLIFVLGLLIAVLRCVFYVLSLRPSLSLWGRLATGRLILPSYDRVFLVPLLILAVSVGLTMLGSQLQLSPEWYVPVSVMILTMIAFTVGQSMAEWRLTATCRLTPRWMNNVQSLLETK
ncbi:MAG: hypothetical protein KDA86_19525 [Planctomycetaceae bacterium]|nr:hypothetical protein [Planctomycetaceae bacterium]